MNGKEIHATAKASIAAFIFIAVSTILSEISADFKSLLVRFFTHHWIAKSVLSVVVFALVYYYYSTRKGNPNQHVDAMAMAKQVAIAAILAGLVIFGFFLWDVLKG
jgi:hypothetical protein